MANGKIIIIVVVVVFVFVDSLPFQIKSRNQMPNISKTKAIKINLIRCIRTEIVVFPLQHVYQSVHVKVFGQCLNLLYWQTTKQIIIRK